MAYSLVEFAQSLQIDRCKVKNTPRLLFLCGGPIADSGTHQSARDFFFRHLKKHEPELAPRVKLAEEINAWFQKDDAFPDLLELENYLAHLADLTLLFVESPGSIAELGAFSASDQLRPKTLAVLNTSYGSDRSFIADGPVRRIKNGNSDLVHYYTWDPKKLSSPTARSEFKAIVKDLVAFLKSRDGHETREVAFDRDEPGHTLLLVSDLARIAGAVTRTDIATCLKSLGCERACDGLDRHISILQSVGFITKHLRSNQAFFVRRAADVFVKYAYRPDASQRNIARIQVLIRQSLDPMRKAILRKALAKRGR